MEYSFLTINTKLCLNFNSFYYITSKKCRLQVTLKVKLYGEETVLGVTVKYIEDTEKVKFITTGRLSNKSNKNFQCSIKQNKDANNQICSGLSLGAGLQRTFIQKKAEASLRRYSLSFDKTFATIGATNLLSEHLGAQGVGHIV